MLDLAAQITRQEIQPGEARFWQETFQNERPEMIEQGFRTYLEGAEFFPKPAQIKEVIAQIRGRVRNEYKPMSAEEKRRLAEDQASPEWQECRNKLDAMFKSWSQSSKMGAK